MKFAGEKLADLLVKAICIGRQSQQAKQKNQANAYTDLVNAPAAGVCTDPMNMSPTCACGMSGKTRVVPGSPDQSLLVEKIGGNPSCGDPMPPTGNFLPDDQQKLIKDWISAGANND